MQSNSINTILIAWIADAAVLIGAATNPMHVRAAEALIQQCPSNRTMESVPFFSKRGRVLAKRLGIRSPIRILALKDVDPPRNVPAERWHGLFCKEWIDADRHCSSDGKVTCRDRTAEEKASHRPNQVECIDDLPFGQTLRVCANVLTEDVGHFDSGKEIRTSAFSGASIAYNRDLKDWCYNLGEDTLIPTFRRGEKHGKLVDKKRDISCESAWNKDEAGIAIENNPSKPVRPAR